MPDPDDQLRRYAQAAAEAVPETDLARVRSDRVAPRRRVLLGVAAAVLAVAGLGAVLFGITRPDPADQVATDPGTGTTGEDGPDRGAGSGLPFGLARCAPDAPSVAAAPERYRDEPVYVGNEMPVDEVQEWARDEPGFVSLWIDRDRNGWITVAFTHDADRRQAELEEAFPGVGVVAVAVEWTTAELEDLRTEATEALAQAGVVPNGSGIYEDRGLVSLDVGELSEERLAPLEPFAGPRLCVEGVDPSAVVPEGDQPTGGDGWRLLGWDRTGSSYRTGVATTDDQYDALWAASGLGGGPAEVDFETEVVIWFGSVYGSGCETRMDDVVIDRERRLVHGAFVLPGAPRGCNMDANPKAYVVAVERDRLPEGGFAVQLQATDPPLGVPEERTVVGVDLRVPGSVAADDQVGPDPDLLARVGRGYVVRAGDVVETGHPASYDLDLGCPFDLLGPFNGVTWRAETPGLAADPPAAWLAAATDGTVEAELLVEESPARLTVTAAGHRERYAPSPDGNSTCP